MKGPLSQIRVSLVTSLGAGQTIFLAGIGATENKVRLLIQLPIHATSRSVISFLVSFLQPILHLLFPPICNLSYALQGTCIAVAALVQYFLMAAFCWMLVEGFYLYLFVVKVYNVSNKLKICHGMSWGKPGNVSITNCP